MEYTVFHAKRRNKLSLSHHTELLIFSRAFSSAGFPNLEQPNGISKDDGRRPNGMTFFP